MTTGETKILEFVSSTVRTKFEGKKFVRVEKNRLASKKIDH